MRTYAYRTPNDIARLHECAAEYFEKRLEKVTGEEAERLGLERLYHRIRANEEAGIKLFQEMAEELTRYRFVNRLRVLLNDAKTYPFQHDSSRAWTEYYNARLAQLEHHFTDAERMCTAIGENRVYDAKLRAYALCDLGEILIRRERICQSGVLQRAKSVLESSQRLAPKMDAKLIFSLSHLSATYIFNGEWEKALELLQEQLRFFEEQKDIYGVVWTLGSLKMVYSLQGNWRKGIDVITIGSQIIKTTADTRFLMLRLTAYSCWARIWAGYYADIEDEIRDAMEFTQEVGDEDNFTLFHDLGLDLGLQGRYREAERCFALIQARQEDLVADVEAEIASGLGFRGMILAREGEFARAETLLLQSLSIKERVRDTIGIPELLYWLGELHEADKQSELSISESFYYRSLEYRWVGRHYFIAAALTGLVRVKAAQGDYAAIPLLLTEAEQLAQEYEYNDHLASLRLTHGHLSWDGHIPESGSGFDAALRYYQHALICALRYNRFLLDETLSGRPQGTPLRPIISYCLEQEEGQRMLMSLRDWWRTGVNDIGTSRPDTISPLREGIPLLEAERIAREREPGDGSPQKGVVEQLEQGLARSKRD